MFQFFRIKGGGISMKKEKNKLIEQFLSDEENKRMYQEYLKNPIDKNRRKVNLAFKKYYKEVRTISYLQKVIEFETKRLDKKQRIYEEKHWLILDKPVNDEKKNNLYEIIPDTSVTDNFEEIHFDHLEDYFENPLILNALAKLTKRQKDILYLAFVKNLKDGEIAKQFVISQQAVTKTKNKALEKLRRELLIAG